MVLYKSVFNIQHFTRQHRKQRDYRVPGRIYKAWMTNKICWFDNITENYVVATDNITSFLAGTKKCHRKFN